MELSNLTSTFIKAEIIALLTGHFVIEDEGFLGSVLDEVTPEFLER